MRDFRKIARILIVSFVFEEIGLGERVATNLENCTQSGIRTRQKIGMERRYDIEFVIEIGFWFL